MSGDRARDAGYDDFLDAVTTGDGYYLRCSNDHGWLPPRRVCPMCGDRTLRETPLPAEGTILVTSTVHVTTPQFSDDAPYVVALAEFGPVTLTGQLREVDNDDVERGMAVEPTVVRSATTDDRLLGFTPA